VQPFIPSPADMKRDILDSHGWYIHVTGASREMPILAGGLDPAYAQDVCSITGETQICYAPVKQLGHILFEIGGATPEHKLLVVVIKSDAFIEAHAFPDTTHQSLAEAQDTPADLEMSLEERWRFAYTRPILPEAFADNFVVKNLYNPFLPLPD